MDKNTVANAADGGALTVMVSAFFGFLPDIAAFLSIIWLALRIWESETVQKWRKK